MSRFVKLVAGVFALVALVSSPMAQAQPAGRIARGEVVLGHKDDAQ